MTEIRFYHLQSQTPEHAVPQILYKAYSAGKRVVARFDNAGQVEHFNQLLWTYRPESFLPHGSKKDGQAEHQPIWLTDRVENPNAADMLLLYGDPDKLGITGAKAEELAALFAPYNLCCYMMDGHDAQAVTQARACWKTLNSSENTEGREEGESEEKKENEGGSFQLTYWQQDPQGGWAQKN